MSIRDKPIVTEAVYEDRLTAFIDILGFSNMVRSISGKRAAERVRGILAEFEAESWAASNIYPNQMPDSERRTTIFSDNILLSDALGESREHLFLYDVGRMQIAVIHHGVLCRGCMLIGKLNHQGNVVFGRALIDAYHQERELAVFPRIIVESSLARRLLKGNLGLLNAELLRPDSDGHVHVHILSERFWGGRRVDKRHSAGYVQFMRNVKRLIVSKQRRQRSESMRQKYQWLATYFDETVASTPTLDIPPIGQVARRLTRDGAVGATGT